jgi:predicted DNA-binding transcriptional regulator AlpA
VVETQYIIRKQVRARFGGISSMTLWRWEHNNKLGFPKGIDINGRKYYDLEKIEAWETQRALASDQFCK